MAGQTIRADGVELAAETFGDPGDPPILLVMGVMCSMLWWPEEFCRRLADSGRYVIRYDHRDTGLSTNYPPGEPGYDFEDMADDAVRVLGGFGIASAHIVGMSMGGMVAQLAALKHPARFFSLTVISSSPIDGDWSALPGSTPQYQEHSAKSGDVDWSDRARVIRHFVDDSRAAGGSGRTFDEAAVAELAGRDFDRARNFASAANHTKLKGGAFEPRLGDLKMPLLVIHGTADPLFPIEHGVAVSTAVDGARLIKLEGAGHELHEADWDAIIGAIVEHTGEG
jgi:pimeloyl-ACP methyl ester carboxylesterase